MFVCECSIGRHYNSSQLNVKSFFCLAILVVLFSGVEHTSALNAQTENINTGIGEASLRRLALRLVRENPDAICTDELISLLDVQLPNLNWEDEPLPIKSLAHFSDDFDRTLVLAAIELGRRVAEYQQFPDPLPIQLTSSQAAVAYCQKSFVRLVHARQEEMHVLTLDTKNRVIASHQVTKGTLDASLVHPREIFRPAITDAASSIMLVHNHPSGDPTPSKEDLAVTDRIERAAKLLGFDLLDHIVVAKMGAISIREFRESC